MKVSNRSGNRVNVQGNSDNGLNVNNWNDDVNDNIGVSASRNFFKSFLAKKFLWILSSLLTFFLFHQAFLEVQYIFYCQLLLCLSKVV